MSIARTQKPKALWLDSLIVTLLAALLLTGCAGMEPYEPRDIREEGMEHGIFTGSEGEFVISRKVDEPETGSETGKRLAETVWAGDKVKVSKSLSPAAQAWEKSGKYMTIDGHKIFYHDHGKGPVILLLRLRKAGLHVKQQHPIKVFDEDRTVLGDYFTDLLVEKELIVELKACKALASEHVAQLLGYLRACRIEHVLLINFGAPKLQIKKFALSETK